MFQLKDVVTTSLQNTGNCAVLEPQCSDFRMDVEKKKNHPEWANLG